MSRFGIGRWGPGIAALVAALMCAGCGASPSDGGEVTRAAPNNTRTTYAQYTDSVFVNDAYMQEINGVLAMRDDNADVAHAVLADRTITAEEMNELENNEIACFAQYGWKPNVDYWFSQDGGVTALYIGDKSNEEALRISDLCDTSTGYALLVMYYYQALYNPDNIDLRPYVFQCFQEHGLVDKSMTYDEYGRVLAAGKDPLIGDPRRSTSSTHPIWETCSSDPLHNIANSPLNR